MRFGVNSKYKSKIKSKSRCVCVWCVYPRPPAENLWGIISQIQIFVGGGMAGDTRATHLLLLLILLSGLKHTKHTVATEIPVVTVCLYF